MLYLNEFAGIIKTPKKANGKGGKSKHKVNRVKRKRALIDLFGGKCVDCGYSAHLAALDFDHINPKEKEFPVCEMLTKNMPFDMIVEEAKKCVIRCANCHRIKTYPNATI